MSKPSRNDTASKSELSERERHILQLVVDSFITTAGPVGSRSLAKQYSIGLSPASIRNTMSDLEDMGYLDHPYTSAGRVPTELGYRTFVDELMSVPELSPVERKMLQLQVRKVIGDTHEVMRESSRLLGRLSNLLGVTLSPKLSTGVLERLEVVPLTAGRVMFVLSVRGGLVKTIVLELDTRVKRRDVDRVVSILNERLAGLTLEEIRRTYARRVKDLRDEQTGIVRLVLNESSTLFSEPAEGRLRFGSAQHIMAQPEFQESDELRRLMELLEDEDFVVHLLEEQQTEPPQGVRRVSVSIGRENSEEKAQAYSIVTAPYEVGGTAGTLGVIGPTRMDYGHVVALVENMSSLLSKASLADD